jgi:hypothetical protein
MMEYKGSCHCGAIAFTVTGDLAEVIECNCSICSKKGALLWRVPASAVNVLTPAAEIASYSFGKQRIKHRFCPKCGIHLFAEGAGRPESPLIVVNARCLENISLSSLSVQHFDGHFL